MEERNEEMIISVCNWGSVLQGVGVNPQNCLFEARAFTLLLSIVIHGCTPRALITPHFHVALCAK